MGEKLKGFIKDLLQSLIIAIIIVFILFQFVLISVEVEGSSMEPNLYSNQRGVSFIITKNFGINRFDIVVIDSDKLDALLVKRVIGMPNEIIKYEDNKLYINGEYVEEDFLGDVYTGDFEKQLGEDEYFCLGDNRDVSRDSRFYGPFHLKELRASNIFIYYPFSDFGLK